MNIETSPISFTKGKFFSIILGRYLINRVFIYMLMLATLVMAAYYQEERYIAHIAIVGILGFILFEIFKYWNYVSSEISLESYGNYHLSINDVGLTISKGATEQKIKWKNIVNSSSFVGALVVASEDGQLVFIPKSSIPDIQSWNQLKAFIKGKF